MLLKVLVLYLEIRLKNECEPASNNVLEIKWGAGKLMCTLLSFWGQSTNECYARALQ